MYVFSSLHGIWLITCVLFAFLFSLLWSCWWWAILMLYGINILLFLWNCTWFILIDLFQYWGIVKWFHSRDLTFLDLLYLFIHTYFKPLLTVEGTLSVIKMNKIFMKFIFWIIVYSMISFKTLYGLACFPLSSNMFLQ